jgi:hypothetical protein
MSCLSYIYHLLFLDNLYLKQIRTIGIKSKDIRSSVGFSSDKSNLRYMYASCILIGSPMTGNNRNNLRT